MNLKKIKAVISTSGNPFHYGHYDLYQRGEAIFGKGNVAVLIAQNLEKENTNINSLTALLQPYNMNVIILPSGIALARFLQEQNINFNIRGIRNAVDAEYELKLDFFNKEINPIMNTIFIPTAETFSNISSSTIKQLFILGEEQLIKKYMNEDAFYRWKTKDEDIIINVYFGQSCVGKSTYLKNNNINCFDVDKHFNTLFNVSEEDKQQLLNVLNAPYEFRNCIDKFFKTHNDWSKLFQYIFSNYETIDSEYPGKKVYNVDWAAVWMYWDYIPNQFKGYFRFIELTNTMENRIEYGKRKGFVTSKEQTNNKLNQLDNIYNWFCKPKFVDKIINLAEV